MNICISNCNNISSATISVVEGRLNIKYAINGTGKSTISKAIAAAARADDAALQALTPYQFIGDGNDAHSPAVDGLPANIKTAIFDESYINQYVFQEDELIKNSFEIFIKTENYEQRLEEINRHVSGVRKIFDENPELESLLSAMTEFISVFGRSQSGIANNSALVRGMNKGNLIKHIPAGLEDYTTFLTSSQNSKWLRWQSDGRSYIGAEDRCPFCARELALRRKKIDLINSEYDSKTIEHLSQILDLFERLGHFFSAETNAAVRKIATNIQGLDEAQKNYLVEIKHEVEILHDKLSKLKMIGFDSLKDIERLAEAIPTFKIDMQFLSHLHSKATEEKVRVINSSIDHLIEVVGQLQGAIARQKKDILRTVERYNSDINSFLKNAGYNYSVSIDETADHSYKLRLKTGNNGAVVPGVKAHLSFGERNALALVLFMYQALYNQANLIVLDDPISSFDKNKKFAILDMLFVRGGSFRGKTALLLTHDFEPVIDAIYNNSSFFEGTPIAHFLENRGGLLSETIIQKDSIHSSIQVADENIRNSDHVICKLIYLRRKIEITVGKNNAWHLLSNLFHKRKVPRIGENGPTMTEDRIAEGTEYIRDYIPDFDYSQLINQILNRDEMIQLYRRVHSNYEKLQIYRLICSAIDENHVLRKFLNETYHVENDFLFQLNPIEYNTVPNYIITECDQVVGML